MSDTQRLLSVAAGSRVHGARHEAVIGLPGSAAASMAGIERAAVTQRGIECQLVEGMNSHRRPKADIRIASLGDRHITFVLWRSKRPRRLLSCRARLHTCSRTLRICVGTVRSQAHVFASNKQESARTTVCDGLTTSA